jgi:hypothetical protein
VAYEWAVANSNARALIRKQLVIGALAGVVATAAYDLTRLSLTSPGPLNINPFETFGIFGRLIIGSGTSESLALAVGTAYHLLNGVAFAVAFCFLLGGVTGSTGSCGPWGSRPRCSPSTQAGLTSKQ